MAKSRNIYTIIIFSSIRNKMTKRERERERFVIYDELIRLYRIFLTLIK